MSPVRGRIRKWGALLTLLGLAAALAPFVLPPLPVGADLPKHLFVARVYSAYDNPLFRFPEHFERNPRPVPTFMVTVLLALAMKVVAPFTAAKLFLAVITLGLWFFSRGLLRALGAPTSAALIVLPLSNSGFVFSGYLGYVASVALYPALLWVLVSGLRGTRRFLALAGVLMGLYGFHIVGWAVGCLTVAVFAGAPLVRLEPGEPRSGTVRWLDLGAFLLTAPLLVFSAGVGASSRLVFWHRPLNQIKDLLAYTAAATTKWSAVPFVLGVAALMAAAAWAVYTRRADGRFAALAGLLMLIGVLLPFQYNALVPTGARTMPFALIALAGSLRLGAAGWRVATSAAAAVMLSLGAINTRAVFAEQAFYREFMAGIPSVAYGSRILPVIEGWGEGWGALTSAHYGIEDTYNLARGGTNPMMYAYPDLKTAAYLLTYRQPQPASGYKWDSRIAPPLTGAPAHSDFVVLFGHAGLRDGLAREMDLCFSCGRLAIFGRRGSCLR